MQKVAKIKTKVGLPPKTTSAECESLLTSSVKSQKESRLKTVKDAEVAVKVTCQSATKRRKRATSASFDVDIEVTVKVFVSLLKFRFHGAYVGIRVWILNSTDKN